MAKRFPTDLTQKATPIGNDLLLVADSTNANAAVYSSIDSLPVSSDTQAALNTKVDKTTTVNGHALSSNVSLTTDDIPEGATNLYDQVVSILNGVGITVSGTYPNFTITNASPDQVVALTQGTGITISGTYPNFTITNSAPDQTVVLTAGTNVTITGTYPNFTINSTATGTGDVVGPASSVNNNVVFFDGITGKLIKDSGLTLSGSNTGDQDLSTYVVGPASSTDNAITRFDGITGKLIQNSSATLNDNGTAGVNAVTLSTTPTAETATGTFIWNTAEGTSDLIQPDGVTLQLGQETQYQIKATATITNGQLVMYDGSDGNSGNLKGKPSVSNGTYDEKVVLGIATQDIANGGFGKVTRFGKVRGIQTNGVNYGETWLDGDVLYPNPNYVGGLTNIQPTSPAWKNGIAIVINAHPSNGTLFARVSPNPTLGDLNDVDTTTEATGDIIMRNGTHWINTPLFTETKQMTGFIDIPNITVSYDSTARTITLTHSSGTIVYYWKGQRKTLTSPWTSSAHGTTLDTRYYLYSSDGTNITWSTTQWTFDLLQVAYAFYGTSDKFGGQETHGLMPPETHLDLHRNIGTFRYIGGGPTAGTYVLNSSLDADITPGFDQATIYDEDKPSVIPAWIQGTYTTGYTNASNIMVFNTSASFPFTYTVAGYINWFNAGVSTQGVTNKFYNVYQILIPVTSDTNSQKYRTILLQPQAEYSTLSAAQAEDVRGLNIGNFTDAAPESVFYTRMTFGTNASYGTTGKVQLNGLSYVTGSRASMVNVSGFSPTDHANLTNLSWTSSGHTGTASNIAGFDGSGLASLYTLSGTGTVLPTTTSPTFTTPNIGAATGTTLSLTGASSLTLGTSSSATGAILFKNSTNANTLTLQSGASGADMTYTLPTAYPGADGYALVSTTGGVMSWAAAGGLSWGSSINGSTGTGLALTMNNSYAASGIGQSITIGNTQTQALVGLQIDSGTSAVQHKNLLIKSLNGYGIHINEYASATQGTNYTFGIIHGKSYNTNSAVNSVGAQFTVEANVGGGVNSGVYILNKNTSFTVNNIYGKYGLFIDQSGAGGTALEVYGQASVNSSTNGLVNYTLNNTQTGATVMQKIDTGTSAQAQVAYLAQVYNASTTAKAFNAQLSTTGTGIAYNADSSALSGAGQLLKLTHTASGTLTACSVDQSTVQSSRTYTLTSGSVTDNYNVQYLKRTSITTGAGGTLLAQGSVLKLENVATQTAGTLTDSVPLLSLAQSNNSTGGHILFTAYSGTPTVNNTLWYDGTNLKYINNAGVTKTVTVT